MGLAKRVLAVIGLSAVGIAAVLAAEAPVQTTVEGLFAKKSELKDHTVQVSGKVVKATMGVMHKNFYHIQDGSGAAGTNDVTVTSLDTAAVGDQVTVTGKLVTDQDFGAGYSYPLLIDQATLTKGQ